MSCPVEYQARLARAAPCVTRAAAPTLLVRSAIMEQDVHTLLDLLTFAATGWVIFMMLTRARASWQADKDVLHELYVVRRSPRCPPARTIA